MKRVWSILGTLLVVAVLLGVGFLKWFNVFGQEKLGGPCNSRVGCRSYWCLAHARRGGTEIRVAGYCTDSCERDADCAAPGMKCVIPSHDALEDLAQLGRPTKLCQRVE